MRREQGEVATIVLQGKPHDNPPMLSILCGDLNFKSTEELTYLTARSSRHPHPYHDSINTFSDPAVESPESASIGITFPSKTHSPRRSDFVLYTGHNWTCAHHTYFGNTPIHDCNGTKIECEAGKDGYLYPSDHLGVLVELKSSS
jgi:endonuclease/exonuclease/phosphatase family metal-dependent hydrolase